ncbi:hypothetical protein P7C70_g2555, partial [Phenoliferia sp. Uapishka_3]
MMRYKSNGDGDRSPTSTTGTSTPPLLDSLPTPPLPLSLTTPISQRSAAINLLRRAASTRESPSTSPLPSPTPPASPFPSHLQQSTSNHRHTNSADSPLYHHLAPASSGANLERTASLLARSIAMAKLTGEALPTPPSGYYPHPSLSRSVGHQQSTNHGTMPTLGDLRERVKLKRNNTVTGVGGSHSPPRNGDAHGNGEAGDGSTERTAARVNLMRKLSSRRLESPAAKDSLEARDKEREKARLDVVGRIGKARPRSGSVGDWRTPPPPDWNTGGGLPTMDMGSPLAMNFGQGSLEREHHEEGQDRSTTPFSYRSSGAWTLERDRQSVLARLTGEATWEFEDSRNETLEEEELILPTHDHPEEEEVEGEGNENEYDRSDATDATPRPPIDTTWSTDNTPRISAPTINASHPSPHAHFAPSPIEDPSLPPLHYFDTHRHSSGSLSPPTSPGGISFSASAGRRESSASGLGVDFGGSNSSNGGGGGLLVNPLRRGSIPHHLLGDIPVIRRAGPASFGIGAVEETDVRRRGSSASSSVAMLDAVRTGRRLDSTSGEFRTELGKPTLGMELNSDENVLTLAEMAKREEGMMEELGDDNEMLMSGRKGSEEEWTLTERRLVAKVERKREMGLARSKEGAFPPPDEGYQFPSPTMDVSGGKFNDEGSWVDTDCFGDFAQSPRQSEDINRALSPELGATSPQDPLSLFERPKSPPSAVSQWGSSKSPRASLASRRGNSSSSIFTPSYMPLSIPDDGTQTPPMQPPLSPTSIHTPSFASPPILPNSISSSELERNASGDSRLSKPRWLGNTIFQNGATTNGVSEASTVSHASPVISSEMTRGGSATLLAKSPSAELAPHSPAGSGYASSTDMRRELSSSSTESLFAPVSEVVRLPVDQLPANRIIAKLDSILGTADLRSNSPSVLDHPPRRLLLHTPVLQIVNAHTVKDRHLFLFTDLLLIGKPILDDHPLTGQPLPSTLESSFVVKSVVELKDLKLQAIDEPPEDNAPKKRHPLVVQFVDRFANDPTRAIAALIQKNSIVNDAPTIANLLFRNPDLSRNQVGTYLSDLRHTHILKAYVDRFRLSGVRIDDALRLFLLSMRLPSKPAMAEHVLGVFSLAWAETNGASGFDPSLTTSLVLAIIRLSDTLHPGLDNRRVSTAVAGETDTSVDDFIASFREHDPRLLVPEVLLTLVYSSVRRERIEQASDNSMFSMTPDIDATIEPARIPGRLTYRVASEPITITIPEPDPKFHIKLHGNDLKFDPPYLTFAKSATQTFRVTGSALGIRSMVLIKLGANSPRYQGLPLNKTFSIERAFMQNTFQISFVNHLEVKRKYMFSTLDTDVRAEWLQAVRDCTNACLTAPPPPTRALQAGSAVAVQVLRDALIAPESIGTTSTPSPRPTAPASRITPTPLGTPRLGRLGTPTRPGLGAMVRSNSFSRMYASGIGKVEADLVSERDRKQSIAAQSTRRSSRDDVNLLKAFAKTGKEIQVVTEQNSLLPLMLSFLSAGASVAPHPLSTQGSAFSLPPLPPSSSTA